ncbi:hypothetical protein J437_LFUL003626 [Ladona fulva]|uniref:Uncharacterized protein n=1 Tax=Ladona fulva TaxID=123851 RepID=A0A8K0JW07_LADFU|nr:hypothetical protein J437_LFUL003626 [Ladona fulva]
MFSKSSRRSFGSGDVMVLRRDYVMTRAAEGRSSEHKRLSTPPAFNQTTPLFRISSLSGVFKEWMSKMPKIPWLSKRTGSSMAQDKNLTLLHARHCLTCILLVIAVISLGATFVSTDAQSDRWQRDYYHEFWKALQPHVSVRHYERHPV